MSEQRWLQENTWCEVCGKADLGMNEPQEYSEGSAQFVEGTCRKCGGTVRSEINAVDIGERVSTSNKSLERTRDR